MNRILIAMMACFLQTGAYAETLISGGIFANVTWEKSKSPYIVTGNLIVFDDVTLTIEPGVTIKFNQGIKVEFRNSKLYAVGTSTDSITFTTNINSPSKGSWEGIYVLGSNTQNYQGDQITMKYVKGMYSNTFLLSATNLRLNNISNSTFSFNNIAFSGGNNSLIDHCTFYKNGKGTTETFSRGFKVTNTVFDANTIGAEGLRYTENCVFKNHTEYALYPYGITQGCYFEHNKIAVYSPLYNSENDTFINNTVVNNETGVQMGTYFNGYITFTGNKICDNTLYNLERIYAANAANLANNCWCSTDMTFIESKIRDAKDDISLAVVTISPISTNNDCVLSTSVKSRTGTDVSLISISPIPAIDYIKINGVEINQIVSMMSQDGLIAKSFVIKNPEETLISISELPSGIYGILVNGRFVKKMIKL